MKETGRDFLTDNVRQRTDFSTTDQSMEVPMPPVEKPPTPGAKLIALPQWEGVEQARLLSELIDARNSVRGYAESPLALEELSYLLWATQGVRKVSGMGTVLRNVPSAGNRHSFETYLSVHRVDGLEPAVYRYLPLSHELVRHGDPIPPRDLAYACYEQPFCATAAVTFFWTTVPYRTEWRYADASYKVIAVDAGHVCQNLYLAATAIGAGTCAIGAYRQDACDRLLELDTNEEFTIYIAPVGKLK